MAYRIVRQQKKLYPMSGNHHFHITAVDRKCFLFQMKVNSEDKLINVIAHSPSCSVSHRSASMAAMHPVPAAVTACR
mgnify:CR=1 FL=1